MIDRPCLSGHAIHIVKYTVSKISKLEMLCQGRGGGGRVGGEGK